MFFNTLYFVEEMCTLYLQKYESNEEKSMYAHTVHSHNVRAKKNKQNRNNGGLKKHKRVARARKLQQYIKTGNPVQ